MASLFTRVLDKITPWDRKGEVQRRKKKEDEQQGSRSSGPSLSVSTARPTNNLRVEQPKQSTPKTNQLTNVFRDINKPTDKVGVVSIKKTPDVEAPELPKPGVVVKPTEQKQQISGVRTAPNVRVRVPGSNQTVSRSADAKVEEADPNIVSKNTSKLKKAVAIPALNIARVGTGLIQGGAGVYDLLTPGKGQNRVTQGFTRQAEDLDATASRIGVNKAYKVGNVLGEGLTYFAGLPVKAATVAPKVANAAKNVIGNTSRIRRIGQGTIDELTDARNIAQEAQLTGRYTGQDSARGEDINSRYIAENAGLSLLGTAAPAILRNLRRGGSNIPLVDEAAAAAGANEAVNRVRIPVSSNIPVSDVSEAVNIPINRQPSTRPMIQEIGGDATTPSVQPDVAGTRFANQKFGTPDPRLDGLTRVGTMRGNAVITPAERAAEHKALDDAFASGELDENTYKLAKAEVGPVEGRQIEVTEQSTIPVREDVEVPSSNTEAPKTSVTNKTEEATAQAAATPPTMARGVKEVLDNPDEYSEAEVKLAQDKADQIQANKQPENGGFVPTGEEVKGVNGNITEKMSLEAEDAAGQAEIANRSDGEVVSSILNSYQQTGTFSPADFRQMKALFDTKRITPGHPLYNEAKKLAYDIGSHAGRMLREQGITLRREATGDSLANRAISRIYGQVKDPSKIDSNIFKKVYDAENAFTEARDAAKVAEDAYKTNRTPETLAAVEQSIKAAKEADAAAAKAELDAAIQAFKNNAEEGSYKIIRDLENRANRAMMDFWTANQLSGPATGFRNFTGNVLGAAESLLFSGTRAKLANKFSGGNTGKIGAVSFAKNLGSTTKEMASDMKNLQAAQGWNPINQTRALATNINSLGKSIMDSQTMARMEGYYREQAAREGFTGPQLDMEVKFRSLTDADDVFSRFNDLTLKASGLSGILQRSQKIESRISDAITDGLSAATGAVIPQKYIRSAAQLVTRIALGYPTATANFLVQSGKRTMLGTPSLAEAFAFKNKDPQRAAEAFDRFLKEAGSGAAMLGIGYGLANAGLVSGAYPDDPEERARWEREGIVENSIKIGGEWRPIPQGLGMFGLPILLGATQGSDDNGLGDLLSYKNLSKLLPTDQVQGTLELMAGNGTDNQVKNFVASTIRTGVPLGSLFNQVAKGLDPTKNDTTTKSFWNNVFDQLVTGIPGQHSFADIPTKTADTGAEIQNPGFWGVMTGATSKEQASGVQESQRMEQRAISALGALQPLIDDPNLAGLFDADDQKLLNKINSGKAPTEKEVKSLRSKLIKGVKVTEDSPYMERDQYDTNLAVLRLKLEDMKASPTTKPSEIKRMETNIKRGEYVKENNIPYEDMQRYKNTTVEEWRELGNPKSDKYKPELYQALWEFDELLAKAGGSYDKEDPFKQKYSAKKSGGGSGGGGGGKSTKLTDDFGKITDGGGARIKVQDYESINTKANYVPTIKRTRPNIVHKISVNR